MVIVKCFLRTSENGRRNEYLHRSRFLKKKLTNPKKSSGTTLFTNCGVILIDRFSSSVMSRKNPIPSPRLMPRKYSDISCSCCDTIGFVLNSRMFHMSAFVPATIRVPMTAILVGTSTVAESSEKLRYQHQYHRYFQKEALTEQHHGCKYYDLGYDG